MLVDDPVTCASNIEIAEIDLGLPSARVNGVSWGLFKLLCLIACDPCALWSHDRQYGGDNNRFSGESVHVRTINPTSSVISRWNDFEPRIIHSDKCS